MFFQRDIKANKSYLVIIPSRAPVPGLVTASMRKCI